MRVVPIRRLASVVLLLIALGGCSVRGSYVSGPYRGRVVDAETKEPLVGAVVLMSWYRMAPGLGHASSSFVDAEETLTDERGEFVVGKNPPINLMPLTWLGTPDLTIFQPGYAFFPRHFSTQPPLPPTGFAGLLTRMQTSPVTFFLLPIPNREERKVGVLLADPLTIPDGKKELLVRKLNEELRNLDLPPINRRLPSK